MTTIIETTRTIKNGERISVRGEDVKELSIILKGKVKAMTQYGEYTLTPGTVIGLCDSYYGMYIFNYFALEDTIVRSCEIHSSSDTISFFQNHPENLSVLTIMQNRFTGSLIATYNELFSQCLDKSNDFSLESGIYSWELQKFEALSSLSPKISAAYTSSDIRIGISLLFDNARFSSCINDACLQMADFLNIDLDFKDSPEQTEEILAIDEMNHNNIYIDDLDDESKASIIKSLSGSLGQILEFSELSTDICSHFTSLIASYRSQKNISSVTDESRKLRRDISKAFYEIYEAVFLKSLSLTSVPPVISMFLNFGYIDEVFISDNSLIELYSLAVSADSLYEGSSVYTLYLWLKAIYRNEKTPSISSLGISYEETILQGKAGNPTPEQKNLLDNPITKVHYEIENLFITSARGVSGSASSFVPILTENGTVSSYLNQIISIEKIQNSIENILQKDFSAFHREIIYINPEAGIDREFILKQRLPEIILLPCSGSNGIMWQEIEGRKKDSPARFILPIFMASNLYNTLISLTARFRWEMCRRTQGAYWNNLAEPSLTAEYCDYIQFYKRNSLLSEAAKERLKSQLTACRNNYREIFVKDYETWMFYESTGSPRLNKVSRSILAKYCPFSHETKAALRVNPLFADAIDLVSKDIVSKEVRMTSLADFLKRKGKETPEELIEYMKLLKQFHS